MLGLQFGEAIGEVMFGEEIGVDSKSLCPESAWFLVVSDRSCRTCPFTILLRRILQKKNINQPIQSISMAIWLFQFAIAVYISLPVFRFLAFEKDSERL